MIKAFIFDMDGTITLSEHLHRRAFNMLLRKYDIYITKDVWCKELVGTSSRYIATKYITKYKLPEDIDAFVARRRAKYQDLVKKHGLHVVAGFHDFLKSVRAHKFKIAIASSGHQKNVVTGMRKVGIQKIPHICIEDVKFRKPHPQIYNKAAKLLGVKPKECVAFEDSPPGIESAKRSGMKVVALLTTMDRRRIQRAKPDIIVKDFRDLIVDSLVDS